MERIERQRHVRHRLLGLVKIGVAQVLEVLVDVLAELRQLHAVASFQGFVVIGKSVLCHLAALLALLKRQWPLVLAHQCVVVARLASKNVLNAWHKGVDVVGSQERQSVRNGDVEEEGLLAVAHFLGRIQDAKGNYRLPFIALVEAFHGGKLHGLMLGNGHCRGVAADAGEHDANEAYPAAHLEAAHAVVAVTALEEHPSTHSHHKGTTQCPRAGDGVEHFVHCHGRERHCPEVGHLVAHGLGVEGAAHRVLHPRVGNKNPQCRDARAQGGEPCRGKVELGRHLLPAKEHHGDERRLHEECQDSLDGKWSAKDVAHKPAVV